LRASSVPRRITCVTCTSLRRRSLFFTWPEIRLDSTRHQRTLRPRRPNASHWPKWAVRAEKYRFKPSLVKRGTQKGGQDLSQRVDEPMGHGLGAGAELKHRKNLGEGIDRQPEPENLVGAAEPGAQFIQLQMREPEDAERALVQRLSVLESRGTTRW
jgi:hypothetical protein